MVVSLDATKEHMWVDCQFVIFSSWKIWLWGEVSRKSPSPQPIYRALKAHLSVRRSNYIRRHCEWPKDISQPSPIHPSHVGLQKSCLCMSSRSVRPVGGEEHSSTLSFCIRFPLVEAFIPCYSHGWLLLMLQISPRVSSPQERLSCHPIRSHTHPQQVLSVISVGLVLILHHYARPFIVCRPQWDREFVLFTTVFPMPSTRPGTQWILNTLSIQQLWKRGRK